MPDNRVYVADKETLDSVKTTAEATQTAVSGVSETANTINTKATNILETGYAVLAELKGQRPKRYGYRVREDESDPGGRVEYLFDAVGMTPAGMNFSTGVFSYGSWGDVWFVRDNKPVMVKHDGTVDYELNHNDHSKKAVDGSASDVNNPNYDGEAMSAMPTVWVQRYHENGYRYVVFCPVQYDESYKAYAHTRPDGTIAPYAYGAMYEGSSVNSKLRSLSGQHPMNSQNANTELTQAQANGAAWTITTWAWWNLIHDLLTLMGKSTSCKAVFGQGHTTGWSDQSSLHDTGALDTSGQFYGYSDTTHDVKVFYIENVMWGDRWERIVGLLQDHGYYKAKMTPEGDGYNFTGAGYESVMKSVASGGWQKKAQQTEYGLFPTDVSGADGYYDACYHWINVAILSVPLVGGGCNDGSQDGRFLGVNIAVSHADGIVGPSLFLHNPS